MEKNRNEDLDSMKLYTLTEIEEVIGCTHRTLLSHVYSGKLPARKIANRWRVTKADLRRYLAGETIEDVKGGKE